MRHRHLSLAILVVWAVWIGAPSALADTYTVNRLFSDGVDTATLVGTVDIAEGNYTITNGGSSPFTAISLTLTANGTPYTVDNTLTGIILGTGQFLITASPTQLIFGTASADSGNPA